MVEETTVVCIVDIVSDCVGRELVEVMVDETVVDVNVVIMFGEVM